MADSMNIFIDTEIPLEDLAKEVGELLGINFEYRKDEYENWYAARTDEGLFTIGTHDFEGEEEWNLNKYKYEVAFWENRDKSLKKEKDFGTRLGIRYLRE